MKRVSLFSSPIFHYVLIGVILGCLFPIFGMLISVWLSHIPITLTSLRSTQNTQPLLWIIDTATLYGFIVGRTPAPLLQLISPSSDVLFFLGWSSLLGALLAFVIFSISAFSVPLLYYRRAGLVRAIQLSVGAVFANLAPCLLWATILSVSIVVSILIFPLFLMAFPVLAFASHALYRELFPDSPV